MVATMTYFILSYHFTSLGNNESRSDVRDSGGKESIIVHARGKHFIWYYVNLVKE